ncbi:MAG: hypothetical protein KIT80_17775 [Chitinophagaceae bacterium]|nr:hypothetical protein [Chitinophagaceae bacterium]MCW5928774.1 hypothetical protein [Chitinophagaceae bacterium]
MRSLLLVSVLFIAAAANAQQKNTQPAGSSPGIPKVWVAIGGFKGGNITPELLSRAIDSAVVVRDDKGNTYPVVRFRVFYKFKSSYTDPETGQTKVFNDMRVNEFETATMSENWRGSIKDNVAKGDEMTIDNIIIRLKNGSKLMAGAVSFKVI